MMHPMAEDGARRLVVSSIVTEDPLVAPAYPSEYTFHLMFVYFMCARYVSKGGKGEIAYRGAFEEKC